MAAIEQIKSDFYKSIHKTISADSQEAVAQLESDTQEVKQSIQALVQKFYSKIPYVEA